MVWTLFQAVEPILDSTVSYVLPFYGSLKTCFLFWIFISRSAATFKVVHYWLRPLVSPYERMIDVILATTVSILLNFVFLASLPISRVLLWIKRLSLVKAIQSLFKRPPSSHPIVAPPSPQHQRRGSDLVPPPIRRPAPTHGTHSLRKQISNSSLGSRPSASGIGVGRPPTTKSHLSVPHRSLSSSSSTSASASATSHPPSRIPSRTRTVSASASSSAHQAAIKALRNLPPPPSGFHPGASGGFAFIPPTPSTPTQSHMSIPPSSISLFSPVVPGSFASFPAPAAVTPLKMPAGAKKDTPKKTRSSTSNKITSDASGLRKIKPFQPVRRSARTSTRNEHLPSDASHSGDEEMADEEQQDGRNVKVTPSKRRSVANANGPTQDEPFSLPTTATKRQKLQVHEDGSGESAPVSNGNAVGGKLTTSVVAARKKTDTAAAPVRTNGRTTKRPPLSQAAKRAAAASAMKRAGDESEAEKSDAASGTRTSSRLRGGTINRRGRAVK